MASNITSNCIAEMTAFSEGSRRFAAKPFGRLFSLEDAAREEKRLQCAAVPTNITTLSNTFHPTSLFEGACS